MKALNPVVATFKKTLVYHLLRALRPRQWLKNLSIYAAPLFWGNLTEPDVFIATTKGLFAFILTSSATYLVNDVVDSPKDRLHPIKNNRPIAHGDVPEWLAMVIAFALVTIAVVFSKRELGKFFALTIVAYFSIQVAYSMFIRNVIILDALTVASGFVIRVFAGTFASIVPISSWLILAVIGLSLLLAFGKRRSERTILEAKNIPLETRETLKHYPDNLLDSMISMSSTFAIVSYALFAFQTQVSTSKEISENLPSTLSSPKWMLLTVPIVIYGVARYLYVIYEKKEGESPERVLLSDRPLLNTVVLWISIVFTIVYGLHGGED